MTAMRAHLNAKAKQPGTRKLERQAYERVLHARVKAPESAILGWIRAIGPEMILSAKSRDILAVANAF